MVTVDDLLFALTLFAALGCGLMAGFFFAFSVSVMKALARLPPAAGIAAMQSINVAVINPVFLAAFLGMAAFASGDDLLTRTVAQSRRRLLARRGRTLSGRHLFGDDGVQRAQERRAGRSHRRADGARLWASYLANWTAWNHIRAAAALAAAASLTIALCD